MPQKSDWTRFEGVWATRRGANMVLEARRLFKARTGRNGPSISQGGRSGSVGASGGTHLREAFDFRTAGWPLNIQHIWEECLWQVGFAAWHRPKIAGLWPEHCHAIPKGGDLSTAAVYQVWAFNNRRNGLRSDLAYPRIGKYAYRLWEQYLRNKPKPAPPKPKLGKIRISGKLYEDIPYVSLEWLREAWGSGKRAKNVFWVQTWLARLGYYKAPRDGIKGPVTIRAWRAFLAANHLHDPGYPNWEALKLLAKKAKTKKPVRVGK